MPKKYQRKMPNAKGIQERELARNGYTRTAGGRVKEQATDLNQDLARGRGYERKKMGSYVR